MLGSKHKSYIKLSKKGEKPDNYQKIKRLVFKFACYNYIAFDPRGFGHSTLPPAPEADVDQSDQNLVGSSASV